MRGRLHLPHGAVRVRIDGPDDAPALLLSHSLAAHSAMWDAQAPWKPAGEVARIMARARSTALGARCRKGSENQRASVGSTRGSRPPRAALTIRPSQIARGPR